MTSEQLITEVMKKAAVIWLRVADKTPVLVWMVWLFDDSGPAVYVVHGGAEQRIPGLLQATSCMVIARSSDNGAQVLTWEAAVKTLPAYSPEWEVALATLLPKRLNLSNAAHAAERWAAECTISRLTPSHHETMTLNG